MRSSRLSHFPARLTAPCITRGDIDGATFLHFRLGDLLLYGWDLAHSVGGDESMDDELVAIVWDTYRSLGVLLQSGAFGAGPSGTVDRDAPLAVRLLDLTGRRPKRRPSRK